MFLDEIIKFDTMHIHKINRNEESIRRNDIVDDPIVFQ